MFLLNRNYNKELKDFKSRILDEIVILLYHGVTSSESEGIENYSGKHISNDVFAEQMNYISKNCNPISMNEYLHFVENGHDLPPCSVIISFDDGFKNNFSVAAPILEEFNIPAIFYVSSGIVNTDLMFWVDIIEDCLNKSKVNNFEIKLSKVEEFVFDNNRQKINAVEKIKQYCKSCNFIELKRVLNDLEQITRVKAQVQHAANYQKISWDELRVLNSNPLFEIGGHSLYHNILSSLSTELLEKEIRSSIDLLEINLGKKIIHYSYPEGQSNHYNEEVIKCLKENKIQCSPSAIFGLNTTDTDLFNLRRIMVGFADLPFPYFEESL